MRSLLKRVIAAAALGLGLATAVQPALSERYEDGLVTNYYKAFKGKKVAFVPISMGFDFTQAWMGAVGRDAKRLGYEVIIRDFELEYRRGGPSA